ncbi:hypothetical protein VTI28DRAFT_4168 [Corynascus sepedonium]
MSASSIPKVTSMLGSKIAAGNTGTKFELARKITQLRTMLSKGSCGLICRHAAVSLRLVRSLDSTAEELIQWPATGPHSVPGLSVTSPNADAGQCLTKRQRLEAVLKPLEGLSRN